MNYGAFIADGSSGNCEITGNKKGVVTHLSDSTITVTGKVYIRYNTKCDVLLKTGRVVAVGRPLSPDSRIGITLNSANLPGPGAPVVATKGLKGKGTAENSNTL